MQGELIHQHHIILAKQEVFHKQRYKKVWALKGDRNTNFFHHSILKRARQNNITYLLNIDGSSSTTPEQIESTFNSYFADIFQARPHPTEQVAYNTEDNAGADDHEGDFTDSILEMQELHNILKVMRSNVASGPDGLNTAIYKAS